MLTPSACRCQNRKQSLYHVKKHQFDQPNKTRGVSFSENKTKPESQGNKTSRKRKKRMMLLTVFSSSFLFPRKLVFFHFFSSAIPTIGSPFNNFRTPFSRRKGAPANLLQNHQSVCCQSPHTHQPHPVSVIPSSHPFISAAGICMIHAAFHAHYLSQMHLVH